MPAERHSLRSQLGKAPPILWPPNEQHRVEENRAGSLERDQGTGEEKHRRSQEAAPSQIPHRRYWRSALKAGH